MIYFTSDTHFHHSNIINLCNRPFHSISHMNQTLIQNWNISITDRDEVYILGDFSFGGSGMEVNSVLQKLKGKKYLIRGNHDKFLKDPEFDHAQFEWIKDYFVLDFEKQKFILFHYPILEWQGFFRESIHLYGHVHNSGKDEGQKKRLDVLGKNAYNVGVDVNDFFPVSIKQIVSAVQKGGQKFY